MATIKDIARETGLSISAVSQVLNSKPCRISEEKKELIFETAKRLNYQKNHNAAALITNKTMRIGVIVYDIVNSSYSQCVRGIEQESLQRGRVPIVVNTVSSMKLRGSYDKLISLNDVDGMIFNVVSGPHNQELNEYVQKFIGSGKPVVFISKTDQDLKVTNVSVDNDKGSYLATRHLLELGHRKIGCISGPEYIAHERLNGYKQALREYNIEFNKDYVAYGDFSFDSGYYLSKILYDKGIKAMFIGDDQMAYGAYRMAQENNIQIPNDLSIVGFCDLIYSSLMSVPLTTIKNPSYDIGKMACKELLDMIDKNDCWVKDIILEPELIVRDSAVYKN